MSYGSLLKPGMAIRTASGTPVIVRRHLGSGGQGEVWEAEYDGGWHALKWYYPQWLAADVGLRPRIEQLVRKGPPNGSFVWPEAVVVADGIASFGYLMPLLDVKRYVSFRALDTRRVTPTFRQLAWIGYQIADAFWSLHARGLCYRDISKDNILFDPQSGNVRIVDNDNVDHDGSPAAIDGTIEFMAPELVRRDPGAVAGRYTDYHSLAVLLFYAFHIHHPLEGKRKLAIRCWDEAAETEMYGRRPVFIFDEADYSNAAQPKDPRSDPSGEAGHNALEFWAVYPEFLKRLFRTAFTIGLYDPHHRITEPDWRRSLVRLSDSIVYCSACGTQNFAESNGGVVGGRCWNPGCRRPVATPFRLTVASHTVMLNADTKLYAHHLDSARAFGFESPAAVLRQHPQRTDVWGLNNLTTLPWTAQYPDGTAIDVPPGRSLPLVAGTRVHFGSAEGVISI
jgi:eukaryotic-like serine/threonine-protein kinase